MDADLPLQPETLADDMCTLVEDLSQIAAALLLNQNRGDDQLGVGDGHAVRKVVHGAPQVEAEILFVEALAELAGNRFSTLPGSKAHRGSESVTRADRAYNQVESLRELLLELHEALLALLFHPYP